MGTLVAQVTIGHTCGLSELLSKARHKTLNSYLLSENTFCRLRHSLTDSDGIPLGSDESGAFPFRTRDFSTKFRSFSEEKVYFAQLCLGNQEQLF